MHTYIYIYIRVCVYILHIACEHLNIYISFIHAYIYMRRVYIYMCMYRYMCISREGERDVYLHACIYMYVCMYVCMHVRYFTLCFQNERLSAIVGGGAGKIRQYMYAYITYIYTCSDAYPCM